MGGAKQKVGAGQIYVWPGGSLWIGVAKGATDLHAHHALQVSFAESGELRFRTRIAGWTLYRSCVVPTDLPHAFDGPNITVAHIFVEPESTTGKRLLEEYGSRRNITHVPPEISARASDRLFTAWKQTRKPDAMIAAAQDALRLIGGAEPPRRTTDERVLAAIQAIRARLDSEVTLTAVASDVHISPSRLRHLFVEETGLTFRSFVLWQRLQRVFAMMTAASMTDAAHAAGFSDAAHMTRTFRRMLGIAPTSLEHDG